MIGFNIVENIIENVDLSTAQAKILELMRDNPKINAKIISKEIGIAMRNVYSNIKTLKTMGLGERVWGNRGGYWLVQPAE